MTASVTVTQPMIDAFAEITGDRQWIHTDPARAARTAAGGTVAHGMLVAALIPPLVAEAIDDFDEVRAFESAHAESATTEVINLGLERLAFAHPVPPGGVLTADARPRRVADRGAELDVDADVTVWLAGERRRIAAAGVLRLRYRTVTA
ncbi:MaoC/PaaZ C-terminal domain-containing protein [Tsukamurella strandjordii]|uniref:MaoC/PaaZ C-terminal domain-containing protein n=1 Tax=Tsukamurella strandjordii TaxID=147577 RepID=A0AA90SSK2_9ACTN|nr:MaoC/PaaZ C-terminal domain-containing protein [Tsukamurella strandjordii]MDP0399981.1 MaoC/PaaZ C-terminal domain-containing protein [Tsukamurella strandjordii]